ncbi:Vomp family autotransporter [Bartonella harrusi]|uniref:Vomp family autotransporter n=1 Tax=Bartonella harrusi TaxID=2961895 RepID=A0ABY5ESY5_9HYPH|nr:Vomp family autotransporter [Bartonella harrusi]UTO28529.1 Vomp family autotransporter [Bartonella harrusi]
MKKYSTPNLVKAVSLGTAIAALLSSVSPVFAAGVSTTGAVVRNSSGADVPYPYGSHGSIVFAGDDDYCGVDNVKDRGGTQQASVTTRITAKEQYKRFVENKAFGGRNPYGITSQKVTWISEGLTTNNGAYMGIQTGGVANAMPEAYGIHSFATGCGSAAMGNYSTAFGAGATTRAGGAQAYGVSALANGRASIAMGIGSEAWDISAVAVGGLANANGKKSIALGAEAIAQKDYAVALGAETLAWGDGSIAIGSKAQSTKEGPGAPNKNGARAYAKNAIAIGAQSYVQNDANNAVAVGQNAQVLVLDGVALGRGALVVSAANAAVAIGAGSRVKVSDGVALGAASIAGTVASVAGYDPKTGQNKQDGDYIWESTKGAISVGDTTNNITRQITGISAGTQDTDAVNVAQLKSLKELAEEGWKLSVDGGDASPIGLGDTVNFVSVEKTDNSGATTKNIKIVKSDQNDVKFDLADNLKVTSVTTGRSVLSDDGFIFTNGARITVDGIDAGNQKITGVATGEQNNDAVNFAQLKEVKGLISAAGGWKLSVNSGNATDVNPGSVVDFVGINAEDGNDESKNIKITKGENNTVEFALNDIIRVKRVIAGKANVSDNGFVITDGPNMTTGGINAGNKQIKGVAEGTLDEDAVNLAQLKEVKGLISQAGSWKLSVEEEDATDVKAGSTVNFSAVTGEDNHKNIKVQKDDENNVKFDLADNLKVTSVTAGRSVLSDDGFIFTNGAKITVDGIDAGNQKITGVATGEQNNDAVNYAQLKELGKTITDNSLVKQEEGNSLITIGKATGGTEVSVVNNENEDRIISGVKDAVNDNEAVNKKQLDIHIADINSVINNIKIKNAFAVLYDKNSDGNVNYNSVTLGGEKNKEPVALHNVRDGTISEDSHDAINGSQINKISQDVASYFGGGTTFRDGEFVGPQYNLSFVSADGTVQQKIFKDVGSALTGLDANVKNVNSRLTYVSNDFTQKIGDLSKDALLWSEKEQAFVALHGANGEKANSKLTFLEDGEIDVNSTDAINGSQLFKVAQNISKYFGGDADVLKEKAPTYIINGKEHHDVGSAFSEVDASITNISNQINNVTGNILVKQENDSEGIITVGKATGGSEINIANQSGEDRTISGVKDGKISRTSTEAINGSQLFTINENVNTVTNNLNTVAQNTSKYFGGGADVLEGIEPSFVIGKETYKNVGDAFTGVNISIKNIDDKIIEMKENNLVQQERGNTGIITIGAKTAGTEINIAGVGGLGRKISGVQKAENGDEAVNKDQLDESIEKISKDIETASAAAVLYDKSEDGVVNYNSVTLGGDKTTAPVALHNVQAGTIAKNSYDAINGSQINKISEDVAAIFGGDAEFSDGILFGPHYHLLKISEDGTSETLDAYDVGSALSGLNNNVKNVNNRLTNVTNEFNQKIDGISKDALLWSEDEQAFVALHKKDGEKTKSKLKFLLDGDIAEDSTDAITGNQLYLMSNQLAAYFGGGAKYENGTWTAPSFKISQIDADGAVKEQTHHNVADALGDLNGGMVNINNRIDEIKDKVTSDVIHWNKDENAYDASHDGQPGKIINVADGKIAQGSKDAVNGGQLWETNERIDGVEKHMNHIENRVDNISTTVTNIGETVNNIDNKVDHIDNKVNDLVDGVVLYDRDENGKKNNKVTLVGGNESEPVTIDNVADGRIEKGSKEAINGGQLHDYTKEQMKIILDQSKNYTDQRVNNIVIDAIDDAVERANNYTNMKFEALNYSIENVRKEARQAAAIGLAVSNLRYNDTPGKLSVAFGSGLWRSQSAFAFGAGYTSEKGNIRSNLSVTSSGGHWGIGAGFNMTLN